MNKRGLSCPASCFHAVHCADGVVVKLKLAGHTAWVSSVAWAPSSAHTLASAGYDHTVRVWDMRASAPVFTVAAHSDKVRSAARNS